MKKRLLALLIVCVMIVGLMACGNNAPAPSPEPSPAAPATPNEPTGETEEPDVEINWPASVEFVVPAGPGGDTDFNARILAAELSDRLPPNFIVSNVTGGGGGIGLREVATSPADGSRAVVFHSAFMVGQHVGTVDFGFEAYDMVGIIAASPGFVLVAREELGITTMEELRAATEANPGQLRLGIESGAFSFALAALLVEAGFDMNVVDAGPGAERIAAMLGGHVDLIVLAFGPLADHIYEGTFVALGIDGATDLEVEGFDIIPSFHGAGILDRIMPFYYFMAFPAGTDPNMIAAIQAELTDFIFNDADYAAAIASSYRQIPTFIPGDEALAAFDLLDQVLSTIDFN